MTTNKWPSWISEFDHPEYLKKIKNEYIVSAKFERRDPFYDRVDDSWYVKLELDVNGQKSHAFISDSDLVEKYEKYFSASDDFVITSDERPNQYGEYTYSRKSKQSEKQSEKQSKKQPKNSKQSKQPKE